MCRKNTILSIFGRMPPLVVYLDGTTSFIASLVDDTNPSDSYMTPTMYAASTEHAFPDLIRLLLEKGSDVNALKRWILTPIHFAIERNAHIDVIKKLLDNGSDVNAVDEDGNTALMSAIMHNAESEISYLLVEHGAGIGPMGEHNRDLLLRAIEWEHGDSIVAMVLESGWPVNALDEYGQTTLMTAASTNCSERLIALLLDRGADITSRDFLGKTALMHASEQSSFLLDVDSNVDVFLQAGASVHERSDKGYTPLMYAMRFANEGNCKLLLERGSDVNAVDSKGQSALRILLGSGNNEEEIEKVLAVLLQAGADPLLKDMQGISPLAYQMKLRRNTRNKGILCMLKEASHL